MTNQILEIFEGFRMAPTPIDQYLQVGKEILSNKIDNYTKVNAAIEFVMLGLPFKSINIRDKVIGVLPDLGEEAMINNFERFNKLIKEVYSPGVKVTVISDGFVFNDILKVNDQN
jgi:pyoverdine/dityrosine biosynthesis protein Dit1